MAIHISRDLLTEDAPGAETSAYLISIFLNAVMNFTVIGHTNFNLTGSGFRVTTGSAGSFNLGGGLEQYFAPDVYTVTSGDIGRILAVRSDAYPRLNSGLFRIENVDTGSNAWLVDYRSSQDPPAESSNLQWSLFEAETVHTAFDRSSTGNGSTTTYATTGSATNSRIILQSSHSSGWQVRLCLESTRDYATNGTTTYMSIAPGFDGLSSGDFSQAGRHLHGAQWFNTADSDYAGITVGHVGTSAGTITYRMSLWFDDASSGSFIAVSRLGEAESSTNRDGWAAFGFCEDEPLPIPTDPIMQMFTMGTYVGTSNGVSSMSWSTIHNTTTPYDSTTSNMSLVAFGHSNQPVCGATSCYTLLRTSPNGTTTNAHPRDKSTATDSGFINGTELLPCDVYAGVYKRALSSNERKFVLEPRRLGRFPLARMGRVNFGAWTTTAELDNNWLHTVRGIYMPWSGSIEP